MNHLLLSRAEGASINVWTQVPVGHRAHMQTDAISHTDVAPWCGRGRRVTCQAMPGVER